MTDSYPVRKRVREIARSHGWRLIRFRKRWDGRYDMVLDWDPIYVSRPVRTQRIELVAELSNAVTVLKIFLSADTNVYFLNRPNIVGRDR